MGRYRPRKPVPQAPPPRQTVVACWVTTAIQPGEMLTVEITPHEDQAPLLLFVPAAYVILDGTPSDTDTTTGLMKVSILSMDAETATIQLPAPVVGLGTKLTIPKTLLSSIPGDPSRHRARW